MYTFRVIILGTRGSVAVEGDEYRHYGGATACVYVEIDDKVIVFDGGSGIIFLPDILKDKKEFNLLLTHSHIDHLAGITCCESFYNKNMKINVYATPHNRLNAKAQIDTLMSPPLWPVNTDSFTADVNYIDCNDKFKIDDITVSCLPANHPGGCTIFRIDYCDKSVVYATDNEINEENINIFKDFAADCTLLLCDGQYKRDEIETKKGFGHSCFEDAAHVGIECNAVNVGIIHHDPFRSDKELNLMQDRLQRTYPNAFFAYFKQEITL